jgi:uncharacterized protein YyaL (SSP411 family)
MPNQLANETSPYLLQHANNPVDWRPWSAAALEESKATQKPIFLSIGYSACHWCHVMEHESFENAEIAAFLNEHFISIKVDREERPDLDQVYMSAVQLLTGRGGWPMSVFLTPELKPFFGGTYWPPEPGRGMPGFLQVLRAVEEAWRVRREAALTQSEELTLHIRQMGASTEQVNLTPDILRNAVELLNREFDPMHGGFGNAPKFPHSMDLQFLLRMWARNPHPQLLHIVEVTLKKMAHGGIYDHLAGGFARYSVDEHWLVPHFEKMLYDNALLMGAYLDAFLVTGNRLYQLIAAETANYLLTSMQDLAGGFHSTEDADSEGEEGKFYVWSKAEILEILGLDAGEAFCDIYGVSEHGNFEGHNILHIAKGPEYYAKQKGGSLDAVIDSLPASRQKLLEVRNRRIRPGKDDKVLTSWNALAISSLARAGAILGEPKFLTAAQTAANFLLTKMRDAQGGLLHTYRAGVARQHAFLDDYAYLVNALLDLFECDGNERWIESALDLARQMLAQFEDKEKGAFFFAMEGDESLIARQKDAHDQSIPSGNGMAATALVRLATLTGEDDFMRAAQKTLETFSDLLQRRSLAMGQMLIALDWFLGPRQELVLCKGSDDGKNATASRLLAQHFAPLAVRWPKAADPVALKELQALATGKTAQQEPALYLCEGFTCHSPAVGLGAIEQKLQKSSLPQA